MSDFTQPSPESNQVDLDFVQQILAVSGEGYCWDPSQNIGADLDVDPNLGEEGLLDSATARETLNNKLFFETLENAWNEADAALALETELVQALGDRMPQPLLQTLLEKAQQAVHAGQTLGDQLVQCVQGLIPQLDADDLLVMARPYALAMRSSEASMSLETLRSSVRVAQWTELSPIERARLSLEISHYVLTQLPHQATS